jgi:PilZ domain
MDAGSDKRRQQRIPIDLWIECERAGELYFQRATNLSVGGAYFEKTIPLPVGTKVALKFALPGDGQEIRCGGETVTAQDLGMGVTFLELAAADQERIEVLIAVLVETANAPARAASSLSSLEAITSARQSVSSGKAPAAKPSPKR